MVKDNVVKLRLTDESKPLDERVPVFYVAPPHNGGAFMRGLLYGLQVVTLVLICISIGAAL
jgi:hypothetical protein